MALFDSKTHLIASIYQQLCDKIPNDHANLETFTNHFFKRAPIELLQKILLSELVFLSQEAWELFQTRLPSQSLLKIKEYQLSHHTIPRLGLFMVNVDQPFLIDSIRTYLDKQGFKIELIVHPVLGVQRTENGHLVFVDELKEASSLLDPEDQDQLKKIASHSSGDFRERNQNESIAFIQIKPTVKRKKIETLKKELTTLISQARFVVSDWPSIKNQLHDILNHVDHLPVLKQRFSQEAVHNIKQLLSWLEQENFIFLGSRYFSMNPHMASEEKDEKHPPILCLEGEADKLGLGLFRDDSFSNDIYLMPILNQAHVTENKLKAKSLTARPLSFTKTDIRSPVHRSSRMDSLEIIDWDAQGNPKGLYQFIGIFTKAAFSRSAFETPIIDQKVKSVFHRFGFSPQWHDGKTLIAILNSLPRDELFYWDEDQIYVVSQNVLNMSDQHSLTLSIRPDPYGRYITVMVFLPKDKYSFALKERFSKILERHFKGKMSSQGVFLGELDYARLIFIVSFSKPSFVPYQQPVIEAALLEATLSWEDYLERLINRRYDEKNTAILLARYQKAFPAAYVETFKPEEAMIDIEYIEKITDEVPIDLYFYKNKNQKTLNVKIFHGSRPLSLSTLLPILQNLGLQIVGETSYVLEKDGPSVWIHNFETEAKGLENWRASHNDLIQAFHYMWNGVVENDGLHQLILKAGLTVNQVVLMRAYLKFLKQAQLPYSFGYLEETLSTYPQIASHLVDLFELRFSLKPSKNHDFKKEQLMKNIQHLLESIDRLDHDYILRRILNAIEATVRTNYFQGLKAESHKGRELKPYFSFKFDCQKLDDLPLPAPLYEIFVYSSHVEAVHLRGAKVARGGIRWSDRPEDFRTEILGLMKAQTAKNSVIVPVGSKGGFVVKNQSKIINPSHLKEEVINCYKTMMCGLLDITDNIVQGKVTRPSQVICYDDEDPYLVVAADKGTASFSDIANSVSAEYHFWLGDAFASGGSAGYDHKKIAITARGAWESVKRHFRDLKHDTQTTPFTVIGVGDMGGDVFGNGMLQSSQIRLLAAFNHQYIFLDPNPDVDLSFQERKRLFESSSSNWSSYKAELISLGGGVFERSLKSIKLSPQCRKVFKINVTEMTPNELIRHLLTLPVDLLYFGGIGTFVKETHETHSDVGDRSNNDIRVDAKTLQAKVIAEGANLAMTQRGRVEYALKGGRLNTDAIDNSAGVDCSDHEVNLKILFQILSREISYEERNHLLKKMTDEVAQLVLQDNYRQTQTLTMMETSKGSDIHIYQSLMRVLEIEGKLNRALEALPDDEMLEQRQVRNQGLTRPELSILLAYGKIALYEKLLNSNILDKAFYKPWLQKYFPKIIQDRFVHAIKKHPLRREITATVLANEIINRVGPAFIYEVSQTSGMSEIDIVEAFFLACHILELHSLWSKIDELDSLMISEVQAQVLLEINRSLEQIILWLLRHPDVKTSQLTGLHALLSQASEKLHGDQRHLVNVRYHNFIHNGIPPELAQQLSLIPLFPALMDIMLLGKKHHNHIAIAQAYFSLGSKIGLDWLIVQASRVHVDEEWQRRARTILIDDVSKIQFKLTHKGMMEDTDMENWVEQYKDSLDHLHSILEHAKSMNRPDLGMLSYAMRQLERSV